MIGKTTYIRSFTAEQRQQMEAIATAEKLTTVPDILFFALDKYTEQKQDIARLNRFLILKQNKIETLKQQLDAHSTPPL